jgi:methionyl-tRNA synthetase
MQKARVKGKWGSNAVITEQGQIVEPRMLGDGLRPSAVTRDLKWGVEVPKVGNKEEDEAMDGKVICESIPCLWLTFHRCLGQS